jgi:UDP-N-acetylmuramoyl-L-alanyl-D-glutamate--2,6-diaminopimelate ligase
MTMQLSRLLQEAGCSVQVTRDVDISGVAIDSRHVKPGSVFLALLGHNEDGFLYAPQAVEAGAAAVLYEGSERPHAYNLPVPAYAVPGLRRFAAPLLNIAHGRPADALFKVGVTGTNGKTTITRLVSALLAAQGRKVIRLGTIDYAFGNTVMPSQLTTPGPDQLYSMLEQGVAQGCDALAMEVSSHALHQDRVAGLRFDRALFTNLTQDHLDFHTDFEAYFAAKAKLFAPEYLSESAVAIVNVDSPYGRRLRDSLKKRGHEGLLTFSQSRSEAADLTLVSSDLRLSGTQLTVDYHGQSFEVHSALVGAINLENLLAAIALGLSLDLKPEAIDTALQTVTVPGRNEVLALSGGAFAVVDYAHTPDALERVLTSLRPMTPGQLICVFGCGGDRDKAKRPLMGGIAARLADSVVVTSDNPRTENAEAILQDILAGMPSAPDRQNVQVIADRQTAIETALASAKPGDCVLVAGKGHEDYQIIGKVKFSFSDQGVIRAFVAVGPSGSRHSSAGGRA